jgi:hypothetical protein
MGWYIAKIIFRICNGKKDQKVQFDEHLRLVEADYFDEAFLRARMLGLQEEASFMNEQEHEVRWEFVNVAEISPLTHLEHGQELYSQIHETEEAGAYIHYIHQKAVALQVEHRPIF